MPGISCSRAHQSLFTLLPSIWCPAVAAPHRKPSGKVVIVVLSVDGSSYVVFGRARSVRHGPDGGRMPQPARLAELAGSGEGGRAIREDDAGGRLRGKI